MSNSVGGADSVQPTSVINSPSVSSADSDSSVSSGFSTVNSVSHVEGEAQSGGSVNLDAPDSLILSSEEYARQAAKTKFSGLQSSLAQFNARFSSGVVDLSDTQTLLMVFRGVINDLKLLNNAQTIDGVLTEQESLHDRKMSMPELKKEIGEGKSKSDTLKTDRNEKQELLDDSEDILNNDMFMLLMSSLDKSALRALAQSLTSDVVALNADIIKSDNSVQEKQTKLAAMKTAGIMVKELDFFLELLSIQPVATDSKESLESGEGRVDQLKRDIKDVEARFSREGLQFLLAKQFLTKLNKETVKVADKAIDSSHTTVESGALPSLLKPVASVLAHLTGSEGIPPLASGNDREPSDLQIADTAEGFALVFLAESVDDGEKKSHEQPYLGDSLSLEGADSPQAYTRQLLEKRVSVIQESAEFSDVLLDADASEGHQLARFLDEKVKVDAMVTQDLRDGELAVMTIRKNRKA